VAIRAEAASGVSRRAARRHHRRLNRRLAGGWVDMRVSGPLLGTAVRGLGGRDTKPPEQLLGAVAHEEATTVARNNRRPTLITTFGLIVFTGARRHGLAASHLGPDGAQPRSRTARSNASRPRARPRPRSSARCSAGDRNSSCSMRIFSATSSGAPTARDPSGRPAPRTPHRPEGGSRVRDDPVHQGQVGRQRPSRRRPRGPDEKRAC